MTTEQENFLSIRKFNGENFYNWKRRVEGVLVIKDLIESIQVDESQEDVNTPAGDLTAESTEVREKLMAERKVLKN